MSRITNSIENRSTSSGFSAIARNTLWLYCRMAVTMGVGLYTSRVVLNVLGVQDFGVYVVVGGVVSLFGFLNSAMSLATQRFLAFDLGKGDPESLHKTFNASVVIHLAIALAVLLVAETIGLWFLNYRLNLPAERLEAANFVYQVSIISSMFVIVQVPFNALIVVREKMGVFAAVSLLEAASKLAAAYLLYVSPYDRLKTYAILQFLATVLISLIYKVYCLRNFEESRFRFVRERRLYGPMISFAGWSLFGTVSGVAKGQGINILLNIFFGTLVNAAYGIMMQVQTVVTAFVANFQIALNPQIFKSYARDDLPEMHGLIFQGARFSYYLILIAVCPIIYNISYLLILWLKVPPPYTDIFVSLVLVNLLIESISHPLMVGAQAHGNIKWYQIVFGILHFLNLPISYLLLSQGKGPTSFLGVALAITVATSALRLVFLKWMIKLDVTAFLKSVLVPIAAVSALSAGGMALLYSIFGLSMTIGSVIQTSLLIIVTVGLVALAVGLTKSERVSLLSVVRARLIR